MHQKPTAAPTLAPPRHGVRVTVVLAAISTAAAFASHAWFGAPGDHPLAMLATGCALACTVGAARLARPFAAGCAAMAGFPIEAAVDLLRHGGHSLLPIEFAVYGLWGLLGVGAATLGAALRGARWHGRR